MKTFLQSAVALTVAMSLSIAVIAAPQRDAGSKARGDIYNFWGARSSHQHAHEQAQGLYHYSRTQDIVPAAPAQEHIAGVRTNLGSSRKALGELKKTNPDNKEALAAIAKIEEIHKKVLAQCEDVEKQLKTDQAESGAVSACCVEMHTELEAASAEMNKLQKALKIRSLDVPAKDVNASVPKK